LPPLPHKSPTPPPPADRILSDNATQHEITEKLSSVEKEFKHIQTQKDDLLTEYNKQIANYTQDKLEEMKTFLSKFFSEIEALTRDMHKLVSNLDNLLSILIIKRYADNVQLKYTIYKENLNIYLQNIRQLKTMSTTYLAHISKPP
jgi:hypothetical protein